MSEKNAIDWILINNQVILTTMHNIISLTFHLSFKKVHSILRQFPYRFFPFSFLQLLIGFIRVETIFKFLKNVFAIHGDVLHK